MSMMTSLFDKQCVVLPCIQIHLHVRIRTAQGDINGNTSADTMQNLNSVSYTHLYPLEQCLVYIRPFAVFLTMIKSDDPVKAIEQVPVLNEYFGSALVAHITISKDIFIGDDATEFNLEGEEASDLHKDSAVKKKNETVQSAGSKEDADTAKNVETKQEPEACLLYTSRCV